MFVILINFVCYIYNLRKELFSAPIDVVGLYPDNPHEEGLASLKKFLDARTEKKVTTAFCSKFLDFEKL